MASPTENGPMADLAKHINQMTFGGSIPYEMYPYNATPANFYPTQTSNKIPVELTSSALDEKDRRRKRSDASKSGAEKDTVPNMHMVGDGPPQSSSIILLRSSEEEHRIVRRNEPSGSARRNMSRVSSIS